MTERLPQSPQKKRLLVRMNGSPELKPEAMIIIEHTPKREIIVLTH